MTQRLVENTSVHTLAHFRLYRLNTGALNDFFEGWVSGRVNGRRSP